MTGYDDRRILPGGWGKDKAGWRRFREDDSDPRAVGEGVVAGLPVLTGDEVHVTDERVGGLPEENLAANEQPRAGPCRRSRPRQSFGACPTTW